MIDANNIEYIKEQIQFFNDKCPSCMGYLDNEGKCEYPESNECI